MQTDKDLFDLIKETYPINPREKFVLDTADKLKKSARQINRRSRLKQFTVASASIAMCTLALSWFFFYGGKDIFYNNFSTPQNEHSASTAAIKIQDPLVYIYHSHNQESFVSETSTNHSDDLFHKERNISLVGERLRQELKNYGIHAIHDSTNIKAELEEKRLSYSDAYKVSRVPLENTLSHNKKLKMVLDIHRDSSKRNQSTISIEGKDYPRIAFIVSKSSAKYEVNFKFAQLLHEYTEERYPNLSRGVFTKDTPTQNSYNQDLFGNSVLLEVGGKENTLEEEYRTVDVLSEVISEILTDWNEQEKE
ncbi:MULTISPECIES: stage II sporulation protein P [Bacillus]|uniref:stage II sporulation protein P n=1 Tax=Bacillus TaxID=1386 RepID=UPI00209FA759|nr:MULTISPECIES: stage II sporulation protein P [Bacillus]MCP1157143.1 stage II sporulation protein P [Bacillus infantis]MDT0162951.1 stage II sporulation protein P [Bacillus sp. AG4(2022)]